MVFGQIWLDYSGLRAVLGLEGLPENPKFNPNSSDRLTSLPQSNLWINISSCITAMRDARIFQLRSIDMRKVCTQECLPKDLLGKKSAGEYRIQNDASPEVNQMAQPFIPNLTSNPLVLTQNDTKKNTGGQRTRKNINAYD